MLSKRTSILSTLLAAWTVSLPSARAESGLLVVGGGAAEHERTIVGGAIEKAIRKAGWSLPANPLTKNEADDLFSCSDSKTPWSCVSAAFSAKDVHGVFVVSVDSTQAANGASLVTITEQMIVTNPPSFTVHQRFCEHCADDRLGAAGEEITERLVREIASRSGQTVVSITSVPAGAEITLDGVRMGATDSTFSTFPAAHVVSVYKSGFVSESREFTVGEGKTVDLTFRLREATPLPPPSLPPSSEPLAAPSRSHLVPGIVIGAGTAFVVLGAISVYQGQKGSPDDKYTYPGATVVGATSSLIGLGAIGTGLYFLWRDWYPSAPTGPSVSATSSGAAVGWVGQF